MTTGNPQLDRAIGDLSRTIQRLQSRVNQLERGHRATQLDSSSLDAGSLTINDDQGNPQILIGLQPDGNYAITQQTGFQTPPTPDDPQVVSSQLGLTVVWDGLIGSAAPPSNFAGVQVHCSTTPAFTPSTATLQGMMTSAGLFAIPNLIPGTTYYVCLIVQDAAGNTGTSSNFISGVAGQLGGSFILPGSVNAADVVMQGSVVASNLYVSYAAQVFLDTPTGWWRLDEAAGSLVVIDWGPSGFNGTPTSGVAFANASIAVDAMPTASFDGVTGGVVTTDTPGTLTAFTIEIWVNVNGQTQTTAFPQIFSNSNTSGSNKGFQLYMGGTSRVPTINIGNGTTWVGYTGAALPASGWTQIVVTYDGANVVVYQNGVAVSTTARTGTVPGDAALTIGTNIGNNANQYKGLLSNAIIYGTALSAFRVQAHYNAAAGAIIANNIAADSITANHILAGSIITASLQAGIIVTGSLNCVGSQGQILVYQTSRAKGNLISSMSGASGTDSVGNNYPQGFNYGVWDAVTGNLKNHFGIDSNGNTYLANTTSATVVFGRSSTGAMEFYDAVGNLHVSISPVAGSGGGTAYDAGVEVQGTGTIKVKGTSSQYITMAIVSGNPQLQFNTGLGYQTAPGVITMGQNNIGGINYLFTTITAPTVSGSNEGIGIALNSAPQTGTSFDAGGDLQYTDASSVTHNYLTWGSDGVQLTSPVPNDANTYRAERITSHIMVNNVVINSGSFTQILDTWNLGAPGSYHIHGQIVITPVGTGGKALFEFAGGGGVVVNYMGVVFREFEIASPTAIGNSLNVQGFASAFTSALLNVTNDRWYEFDGVMKISTKGTFGLFAATNGTGSYNINRVGTYMEMVTMDL